MPTPMTKPKTLLPGQERSITVLLKSLRNPPLDLKLTSQPLSTSVLDIKARLADQTRIPTDKLKLLHNKRPLPDSKILKDILGPSTADNKVELSVMVIGGAAAVMPEQNAAVPATASGRDALTTDAFWEDLNGFLLQRLKDEETAGQMGRLFRGSWESSRATS
ncbi:hypothetical protein E4U54_007961 [Claviceps lovelessii]|nr:hypothetical protein E4U54_007961 [Claviceps lovelessii]